MLLRRDEWKQQRLRLKIFLNYVIIIAIVERKVHNFIQAFHRVDKLCAFHARAQTVGKVNANVSQEKKKNSRSPRQQEVSEGKKQRHKTERKRKCYFKSLCILVHLLVLGGERIFLT